MLIVQKEVKNKYMISVKKQFLPHLDDKYSIMHPLLTKEEIHVLRNWSYFNKNEKQYT